MLPLVMGSASADVNYNKRDRPHIQQLSEVCPALILAEPVPLLEPAPAAHPLVGIIQKLQGSDHGVFPPQMAVLGGGMGFPSGAARPECLTEVVETLNEQGFAREGQSDLSC